MAEQVTAFRSSDGRLFTAESEALRHDLYMAIDKVFEKHKGKNYRLDYNGTTIEAIIAARRDLVEVLTSSPALALYRYEKE